MPVLIVIHHAFLKFKNSLSAVENTGIDTLSSGNRRYLSGAEQLGGRKKN